MRETRATAFLYVNTSNSTGRIPSNGKWKLARKPIDLRKQTVAFPHMASGTTLGNNVISLRQPMERMLVHRKLMGKSRASNTIKIVSGDIQIARFDTEIDLSHPVLS